MARVNAARMLAWILVGFAAWMFGCAERPKPSVLLITIDTLRADHVSAYDDSRASTPNFDALAREGALFESAYCDVPWTTPSMASTLTGRFANRHGMRFSNNRLRASETTVAERLRDAGYRTGAVVASYPLHSRYGLDQGFDTYIDPLGGEKGLRDPRRDLEVTELASRMLSSLIEAPEPFFLWAHYFGPHRPRYPELHYLHALGRHRDTYAERVAATDHAVGVLLEQLALHGRERETLVIVHSDHGEGLGEHHHTGHGIYLFEETLRVPLVARWPGRIPAGVRVGALVANVDIAAMILDAAGIARDGSNPMDGRSLLRAIDSGDEIRDSLYMETYLPVQVVWYKKRVRRYGILRPPWKYIVSEPYSPQHGPEAAGEVELYHLGRDPGELESVRSGVEARKIAAELRSVLDRHLEIAERSLPAEIRAVPEPQLERLRSLGYIE